MSLQAQKMSVRFGERSILDNLSFVCRAGEITAILGENGAGKSTLMNCLAGGQDYTGEVLLNDVSICDYSVAKLAECRAVLPQNSALNFPFNVREVVRLALSLSHLGNTEQTNIIEDCLSMVDAVQFIDRNYLQLSGGEKQRVQLARVLAQLRAYDNDKSQFLFLDEPTSALDLKHQFSTLTMLRNLTKSSSALNIGVLVIMHDLNLASLYCDKILLLDGGRLVSHNKPAQVFDTQTIRDAFGIDVLINNHPDIDKPYLIPRL